MQQPEGWRQLHPLSPFLFAGRLVVFAVVGLIQTFGEQLLGSRSGTSAALRVFVLLVVVALVVSAYSWLAWRVRAFRITAEKVELRTGVVFRSHRHLPLDRIESIDTAQPLIPRMLGLAEVRIEAISTQKSELQLRYLSEREAESVRAELEAWRRGAAVAAPEHLEDERLILRLPVRELVIGYVAIPAVIVLPAVLVFAVTISIAAGSVLAALPVLGLAILSLGPVAAARIERIWNFHLADAGDALVIRRGLLNLNTQRIVTGRIQAVRIDQPPLWRAFGRQRAVVDIAGYRGAKGDEAAAAANLLPVAPPEVVRYLLQRLEVRTDLDALDLRPVPDRARWRAPVRWRCLRAAWTDTHAVNRRGLLWQRTEVVPHAKVQSVHVIQGPWQRRLGLATVRLDTAGTRIKLRAEHRDVREAGALARQSIQRA